MDREIECPDCGELVNTGNNYCQNCGRETPDKGGKIKL